MAGGIRGITVKIGGDTTELGRALSDATTKSTALQKELRGVNSLLKFNPNNVTLLKQKEELLNKAIDETKNKLNALIEAQKKVDAGEIEMSEEEYRNLQREIAAAQNRLENLNEEAEEFGSVNAQRVANFGEKMKDAGSTVESVGRKLSALSAVTGALLGGSVMSASNYEDALAKLSTIADTTTVSMEDLSSEILTLSNDTGIAASDISDATYDAISAGQDTADAVSFVSNATSLAKSGFTSTGASIDLLTTIMNAYGLEAEEVGKVSDMLINTQNKGKTTVDQLASSMGKIIPTANSMNVGLDQLTAGYAIMTSKGIATAESTTYMNSMLNELGKSTTTVGKALKEETGKSFSDLMGEGKSLGDVLGILEKYAKKNKIAFNELWGSSEAGKAGLTLLSDGVKSFNDMADNMDQSIGSTEEALSKLQTPSQKVKVAINELKNSAIQLGQQALIALTPLLDKLCNSIKQLTEWFSKLNPAAKQTILVILAIITALGPLLIAVGKVMQSVGTLMTMAPKIVSGLKNIGMAISGVSAPVLIIVAIIGVLVAAFVTLWKTNEDFRNKITGIWTEIVNKFKSFFQEITDKLNKLGFDFKDIVDVIKTVWLALCDYLAPMIEGVFQQISNIIGAALDIISGIVGVFVAIFTGDWEMLWENVEQIFTAVWDFIKNSFKNIFNTLKNITNVFLGWFGTSWGELWNGAKKLVTNVFNAIKNIITTAINKIKTVVSTVFTAIKTVISTIITNIKNTISNGWNNIVTVTTTVFNNVKNAVMDKFNAIKDGVTKIINSIKTTISNVWNTIKDTTSSVFNGIKDSITGAISGAKEKVTSIITGIKDTVKGIFDGIVPKLKLSLPKVTVSGGKAPWGIAGKGKLPSFDVKWNKLGAIFKKPTIFDTRLGYQGVGEDGPEAVAPINELMGYVSAAVDNTGITDRMDRLEAAVVSGFANINTNSQIVLDTGVLVGETINQIDAGLASNQMLRSRGV